MSADTDGDGLTDGFEDAHGFDPTGTDESALDGDSDGLDNLGEQASGTDPGVADSDADGLNDGDEVNTHLTDPNNDDTDGDGVNDGDEIANGSDPLVPDATTPGDLAPYGAPDGVINAADVLILTRMLTGDITPTAPEISAGDLNGISGLDVGDLVLLKQMVLGL